MEPPKILLKKFAEFYELSMDELVNEKITASWKPQPKSDGSNIRILSISVDQQDRENIELVPVKASAGYLNGYADPEFISDLPKFHLPFFNQGENVVNAYAAAAYFLFITLAVLLFFHKSLLGRNKS